MRHFLVLSLCLWAVGTARAAEPEPIEWRGWSDDIFSQAEKEKKLVVLDLEAVWCHWCHVMAETTYRDPKVVALMKASVIAVRVDQDARPDLSNRYEDYGWPATVIFDSKGTELAIESGYIEPKDFAALLDKEIHDPKPFKQDVTPHFAQEATLPKELAAKLTRAWLERYDDEHGGWGFGHKYLDWDSVEYSMLGAKGGDKRYEKMARQTLLAETKLIDPVWGGVYQYSVGGDWNEPHFEKIMSMQAEDLRIYALAYAQFGDKRFLKAAQDIERFLHDFLLGPEGAYYTSQDADLVQGQHSARYFALDDAGRRKLGMPRIDKHQYARENGWAIRGLLALYSATLDTTYLERAKKAADWVLDQRDLRGGGFRHDKKDAYGPYLGDTLAMGRAFLDLYATTADRDYLERAEKAARYLAKKFPHKESRKALPGFTTAYADDDVRVPPRPERDENLSVARFANLLFRYTGNADYRAIAESALRYASAPELASEFSEAAVLLADRELSGAPLHITVVGPKKSPEARRLFDEAVKYPVAYKRVEWWDKKEGKLPNPDVQYPQLATPSAFICSASRCSAPIQKPEELAMKVEKLVKGI